MYSYQSVAEQVGQLKRRGQTQHHGGSIRTRRRQEESQSAHEFPDRTLVPSDDDQRPAAQETEHGVLGERVVFEEPEGLEPSPPAPLLIRAGAAVDVLGGGGRVRGAGEAGAVRRLVEAQQSERSPGRRPPVNLIQGCTRGRIHARVFT